MPTCEESLDDHRKQVCGRPVTDEVSWPDPGTDYTTTVVHQVCGSCAEDLMTWRANWLNPTRKAL
jgi:hypothetical protein